MTNSTGKYSMARAIIGDYDISRVTESQKNIVDFYKQVDARDGIVFDGSRIQVKKDIMKKADRLADKLADRMAFTDESAQYDYRSIKADLSGTYTISKQDRSNIADFSKYARSKENNVRIGKNGTSLDTKYQELATRYPQYFSASRATNPADQLQDINRVMNSLKNSTIKLSSSEKAEVKTDIRNALIRGYVAGGGGRKAS